MPEEGTEIDLHDNEDTETMEENTEINDNINDSIEKLRKSSLYSSSTVSSYEYDDETIKDIQDDNMISSLHSTSSGEWQKARRLMKIAILFQNRLSKGSRSLSDPEIEIPSNLTKRTLRQEQSNAI